MLLNNEMENEQTAFLVVVMGVSGCGKSSLAEEIANNLDIIFLDADSFHSEEAIKQMSEGIPLTDQQRAPWIDRICQQLNEFESENKSCVLAYSGLKQQQRKLIFGSYNRAIGILLDANEALIAQRLAGRGGHFMSPHLLSSQIASMEPINASIDERSIESIELLILNAAESIGGLLVKSIKFIT